MTPLLLHHGDCRHWELWRWPSSAGPLWCWPQDTQANPNQPLAGASWVAGAASWGRRPSCGPGTFGATQWWVVPQPGAPIKGSSAGSPPPSPVAPTLPSPKHGLPWVGAKFSICSVCACWGAKLMISGGSRQRPLPKAHVGSCMIWEHWEEKMEFTSDENSCLFY